jgi:hypothetical protein
MNAVDQLCTRCGLCCDGTLFADVELRAGDDAKRLAKFGLTLHRKGKSKRAFAQPCACFDGTLCTIYEDRPKRCGWFECGLLKRVEAGEMKASIALKKIAKAKAMAGKVKGLLSGSDKGAALSERYAQAMNEPADLSQGKADGHGKLMRAYADLMAVIQRDFLQ